jgi:hypothetical protein
MTMSRKEIITAIQDALEAWRHLPLDMLTQRIVDRVGDASADELVAAALHVMCSQACAIHTYRCYQMDIGLNISSAEIAAMIDEALVTEVQAPGLIAGRVLERVHGVRHMAKGRQDPEGRDPPPALISYLSIPQSWQVGTREREQ